MEKAKSGKARPGTANRATQQPPKSNTAPAREEESSKGFAPQRRPMTLRALRVGFANQIKAEGSSRYLLAIPTLMNRQRETPAAALVEGQEPPPLDSAFQRNARLDR